MAQICWISPSGLLLVEIEIFRFVRPPEDGRFTCRFEHRWEIVLAGERRIYNTLLDWKPS
jgi:hypothetical protein